MRTAPAHLRRGVAAAVLTEIVAEATRRGYDELLLETGHGPAEPVFQQRLAGDKFVPESTRAELVELGVGVAVVGRG